MDGIREWVLSIDTWEAILIFKMGLLGVTWWLFKTSYEDDDNKEIKDGK